MLVICAGPDTLSAAKKAGDMVAGFKKKYDPSGFSVETLDDPSIAEVLNRISAPSFFSSKRMLRVQGLLDGCKIADVRALAKRLAADAGLTVVLTTETDIIPKKITDEFEKDMVIQYDHPLPQGQDFVTWCLKRAAELGVDAESARQVAKTTDGDAWSAEQELRKFWANPRYASVRATEQGVSLYDRADRYVRLDQGWKETREIFDEELLAVLLSQARAALRAQHGAVQGLHPYVVKKMGTIRHGHIAELVRGPLRTHYAIRSGLADITEAETLL
jgi:hypothetical protein